MSDDYFFIIYIFALGFIIGSSWTKHRIKKELIEHGILKDKNTKTENVPKLITEIHNNMIYVFEKGTDTFVCQGNSIEELAKKIFKQNQIQVAIVEHDSSILMFNEGKVTKPQ